MMPAPLRRETWSNEAAAILDLMELGEIALLMRKAPHSRLVIEAVTVSFTHRVPAGVTSPLSAVSTKAAMELEGRGTVRPLAQFRWWNFIGWREIVGSLGETWDVYLLAQ